MGLHRRGWLPAEGTVVERALLEFVYCPTKKGTSRMGSTDVINQISRYQFCILGLRMPF